MGFRILNSTVHFGAFYQITGPDSHRPVHSLYSNSRDALRERPHDVAEFFSLAKATENKKSSWFQAEIVNRFFRPKTVPPELLIMPTHHNHEATIFIATGKEAETIQSAKKQLIRWKNECKKESPEVWLQLCQKNPKLYNLSRRHAHFKKAQDRFAYNRMAREHAPLIRSLPISGFANESGVPAKAHSPAETALRQILNPTSRADDSGSIRAIYNFPMN